MRHVIIYQITGFGIDNVRMYNVICLFRYRDYGIRYQSSINKTVSQVELAKLNQVQGG